MNLDIQERLIKKGLLDPPADGSFGKQSKAALEYENKIQSIVPKLDNSYASRVVKYMQSKGYFVAMGDRMYNIVYIEGINDDATVNADTPNQWNDLRTIIEITEAGIPRFMGMWNATTEPGAKYTNNPLNPGGAFRIKFGQYKAWQVGVHKDHEALVQCGDIEGWRDKNKDFQRTGDKLVKGSDFGVNQHWGYDMATIEGASAGCLVGRTRTGHREFMTLVKRDRRYQVSSSYTFMATIIAGDDLVKQFPI